VILVPADTPVSVTTLSIYNFFYIFRRVYHSSWHSFCDRPRDRRDHPRGRGMEARLALPVRQGDVCGDRLLTVQRRDSLCNQIFLGGLKGRAARGLSPHRVECGLQIELLQYHCSLKLMVTRSPFFTAYARTKQVFEGSYDASSGLKPRKSIANTPLGQR